jgi:hypothetical protein
MAGRQATGSKTASFPEIEILKCGDGKTQPSPFGYGIF